MIGKFFFGLFFWGFGSSFLFANPTTRSSTATTKHSTSKPSSKAIRVKTWCKKADRVNGKCIGRYIGPKITSKIIVCPLGGEKFMVSLYEKVKILYRDSDLRPQMERIGQKEFLWMCPNTFYTAFPKDFHKPFSKIKMQQALLPVQRYFRTHKRLTGAMRYIAASASYWARGENDAFFAKLFLRAMWAAREEKNQRLEASMRNKTIQAMQKALQKKQFPFRKQPSITYLLAELHRQKKDFPQALVWLQRSEKSLALAEQKTKSKGLALQKLLQRCKKRIEKKDHKVYKITSPKKEKNKK